MMYLGTARIIYDSGNDMAQFWQRQKLVKQLVKLAIAF
jgi:hypothetical protein